MLLAPMFVPDAVSWAAAFGWVVVVIGAELLWVVLMADVPFEEAAAQASADMAKRMAAFRERRAGGSAMFSSKKPVRSRLPLSPTGWAPAALAWKNTLALIRTGSVRVALIFVVTCVVASRLMASASDHHLSYDAAVPYLVVALMAFVFGPRIVRNDLRQDLLHLGLLKTYPLRGDQIVFAEMLSPTLILSAFQLALLITGWFAVP